MSNQTHEAKNGQPNPETDPLAPFESRTIELRQKAQEEATKLAILRDQRRLIDEQIEASSKTHAALTERADECAMWLDNMRRARAQTGEPPTTPPKVPDSSAAGGEPNKQRTAADSGDNGAQVQEPSGAVS